MDLSFFLLIAGCYSNAGRPAVVKTSGRVLIDGQPLEEGTIQFIPSEGRPSFGRLDPGGRFSMTCFEPEDGCLPGKHRVVVFSTHEISNVSHRWNTPRKYAHHSTSDIDVEVSEPTDSIEIQLRWGDEKPFVETYPSERG